jgi:hypothetical protein
MKANNEKKIENVMSWFNSMQAQLDFKFLESSDYLEIIDAVIERAYAGLRDNGLIDEYSELKIDELHTEK